MFEKETAPSITFIACPEGYFFLKFEKRERRGLRSIKREQVCEEYVSVVGRGFGFALRRI